MERGEGGEVDLDHQSEHVDFDVNDEVDGDSDVDGEHNDDEDEDNKWLQERCPKFKSPKFNLKTILS